MNKIWLIAWNTYRTRVRTGSFLFITFALPVLMIVAVFFSISSVIGNRDVTSIGYIDQTGQLANVNQVEIEYEVLSVIQFPTTEDASAAVLSGDIGGYLLVPDGYFDGEPVVYYGEEPPGEILRSVLNAFMRKALLPGESPFIFERLEEPAVITYVSLESGKEVTEGIGLVVRMVIPMALAILFSFAVMFTTGQMGSAVVREKEQRAMEIIITSLRAMELVAGKVFGMSLLVLTQFSIWALGGIAAVFIALRGGLDLQNLLIPWEALLWGAALLIPGYLLFAVLGAGLGIIAGDSQQAQQLAGIFGLVGFVPVWMVSIWLNDPNGTAAVFLTLFPLTGPSVALMRMAFGEVPLWQLFTSLAIVLISLVLCTLIVSRIFRAAMLIYGKTLRPRQIWQALRQA